VGPDPQARSVDDDQNSILDLLLVVVDNLRLLVMGPIVSGLLALGYSFTIIPKFTATASSCCPTNNKTAQL
jgi:uncharacterized protein involved in exopolysaccharide biosynthesis